MKCPKTKIISAYLDDELLPADRALFESHAQDCADCTLKLEEMRAVQAMFASAEKYQAPYGFSARVMARTAQLDRKKPRWFVPLFITFAEAAVLLIVITVGILAGRVMTNSRSAVTATNIASSLSLDLFDATPPGSLGGAYLAMTEVKNEK
jgi:anti-sigma factor RsiW